MFCLCACSWLSYVLLDDACRAAREYLATLDDAAFGAASPVTPKFIARSDPAAQWTGAHKGHAFFAYATNYLIDTDHGVIVDVEATRAIRQAEVGASRTMVERTEERFGLKPGYLVADTAYGSADNLAWLVKQKRITPYIPVFDKSTRTDGTFSRSDFTFDPEADCYICPGGKNWFSSGAPTLCRAPASGLTARVVTARARRIVTSANSKRDVARMLWRGRFHVTLRKIPATSLGRLLERPNLKRPVSDAKRWRCCSPISNAYCDSGACGYGVHVAQRTSSCSPRPRKTCDVSRG